MNVTPQRISDRLTRPQWMAVLARSNSTHLGNAWKALTPQPSYSLLRRPETGLVMLRARMGGTGDQFNLGEASVTRCAVRLQSPDSAQAVGIAYVLGRDHRHAELAAAFDALLQDDLWRGHIEQDVIRPLASAQEAAIERKGRKTASTKVDFYTMVRGEDA